MKLLFNSRELALAEYKILLRRTQETLKQLNITCIIEQTFKENS